jgi:hypothetical protein
VLVLQGDTEFTVVVVATRDLQADSSNPVELFVKVKKISQPIVQEIADSLLDARLLFPSVREEGREARAQARALLLETQSNQTRGASVLSHTLCALVNLLSTIPAVYDKTSPSVT